MSGNTTTTLTTTSSASLQPNKTAHTTTGSNNNHGSCSSGSGGSRVLFGPTTERLSAAALSAVRLHGAALIQGIVVEDDDDAAQQKLWADVLYNFFRPSSPLGGIAQFHNAQAVTALLDGLVRWRQDTIIAPSSGAAPSSAAAGLTIPSSTCSGQTPPGSSSSSTATSTAANNSNNNASGGGGSKAESSRTERWNIIVDAVFLMCVLRVLRLGHPMDHIISDIPAVTMGTILDVAVNHVPSTSAGASGGWRELRQRIHDLHLTVLGTLGPSRQGTLHAFKVWATSAEVSRLVNVAGIETNLRLHTMWLRRARCDGPGVRDRDIVDVIKGLCAVMGKVRGKGLESRHTLKQELCEATTSLLAPIHATPWLGWVLDDPVVQEALDGMIGSVTTWVSKPKHQPYAHPALAVLLSLKVTQRWSDVGSHCKTLCRRVVEEKTQRALLLECATHLLGAYTAPVGGTASLGAQSPTTTVSRGASTPAPDGVTSEDESVALGIHADGQTPPPTYLAVASGAHPTRAMASSSHNLVRAEVTAGGTTLNDCSAYFPSVMKGSAASFGVHLVASLDLLLLYCRINIRRGLSLLSEIFNCCGDISDGSVVAVHALLLNALSAQPGQSHIIAAPWWTLGPPPSRINSPFSSFVPFEPQPPSSVFNTVQWHLEACPMTLSMRRSDDIETVQCVLAQGSAVFSAALASRLLVCEKELLSGKLPKDRERLVMALYRTALLASCYVCPKDHSPKTLCQMYARVWHRRHADLGLALAKHVFPRLIADPLFRGHLLHALIAPCTDIENPEHMLRSLQLLQDLVSLWGQPHAHLAFRCGQLDDDVGFAPFPMAHLEGLCLALLSTTDLAVRHTAVSLLRTVHRRWSCIVNDGVHRHTSTYVLIDTFAHEIMRDHAEYKVASWTRISPSDVGEDKSMRHLTACSTKSVSPLTPPRTTVSPMPPRGGERDEASGSSVLLSSSATAPTDTALSSFLSVLLASARADVVLSLLARRLADHVPDSTRACFTVLHVWLERLYSGVLRHIAKDHASESAEETALVRCMNIVSLGSPFFRNDVVLSINFDWVSCLIKLKAYPVFDLVECAARALGSLPLAICATTLVRIKPRTDETQKKNRSVKHALSWYVMMKASVGIISRVGETAASTDAASNTRKQVCLAVDGVLADAVQVIVEEWGPVWLITKALMFDAISILLRTPAAQYTEAVTRARRCKWFKFVAWGGFRSSDSTQSITVASKAVGAALHPSLFAVGTDSKDDDVNRPFDLDIMFSWVASTLVATSRDDDAVEVLSRLVASCDRALDKCIERSFPLDDVSHANVLYFRFVCSQLLCDNDPRLSTIIMLSALHTTHTDPMMRSAAFGFLQRHYPDITTLSSLSHSSHGNTIDNNLVAALTDDKLAATTALVSFATKHMKSCDERMRVGLLTLLAAASQLPPVVPNDRLHAIIAAMASVTEWCQNEHQAQLRVIWRGLVPRHRLCGDDGGAMRTWMTDNLKASALDGILAYLCDGDEVYSQHLWVGCVALAAEIKKGVLSNDATNSIHDTSPKAMLMFLPHARPANNDDLCVVLHQCVLLVDHSDEFLCDLSQRAVHSLLNFLGNATNVDYALQAFYADLRCLREGEGASGTLLAGVTPMQLFTLLLEAITHVVGPLRLAWAKEVLEWVKRSHSLHDAARSLHILCHLVAVEADDMKADLLRDVTDVCLRAMLAYFRTPSAFLRSVSAEASQVLRVLTSSFGMDDKGLSSRLLLMPHVFWSCVGALLTHRTHCVHNSLVTILTFLERVDFTNESVSGIFEAIQPPELGSYLARHHQVHTTHYLHSLVPLVLRHMYLSSPHQAADVVTAGSYSNEPTTAELASMVLVNICSMVPLDYPCLLFVLHAYLPYLATTASNLDIMGIVPIAGNVTVPVQGETTDDDGRRLIHNALSVGDLDRLRDVLRVEYSPQLTAPLLEFFAGVVEDAPPKMIEAVLDCVCSDLCPHQEETILHSSWPEDVVARWRAIISALPLVPSIVPVLSMFASLENECRPSSAPQAPPLPAPAPVALDDGISKRDKLGSFVGIAILEKMCYNTTSRVNAPQCLAAPTARPAVSKIRSPIPVSVDRHSYHRRTMSCPDNMALPPDALFMPRLLETETWVEEFDLEAFKLSLADAYATPRHEDDAGQATATTKTWDHSAVEAVMKVCPAICGVRVLPKSSGGSVLLTTVSRQDLVDWVRAVTQVDAAVSAPDALEHLESVVRKYASEAMAPTTVVRYIFLEE